MKIGLFSLLLAPAALAAAPALAQSAPAPSTPDTKIGGRIFFNLSDTDRRSDGADAGADGVEADLKRFYVIVDHRFDDVFSASVTTDFSYIHRNADRTVFYVKKAYLQAKLSDAFVLRLGAADMPWIPLVDDAYGYRFVENTLIDRTKYGTSADYGVHVGGTFGKGLVSYAVSAVNGAGSRVAKRRGDAVDLEGRVSLAPVKGVTLAVGGYTGKLGKDTDGLPGDGHRATRVNALVAYKSDRVRAGLEYFSAKNWNNVATPFEDKTTGWSVFGSYAFTPKLALFGRYDRVDPNKLTDSALDDDYVNVGLSYQPVRNVDLALVYKRERVDNGVISTSNGTIGGVDRGSYDEVGIWGQVKF